MNRTVNNIIVFTMGAAVGTLISWKILEKKYKQIADEEIESVKNSYRTRKAELQLVEHYVETDDMNNTVREHKRFAAIDKKTSEDVEIKEEYKEEIEKVGYYFSDEGVTADIYTVKVDQPDEYVKPFVIAPEEYGEYKNFETKEWTYYSDFVLVDEIGEIVTNPELIIGDALEHFGDYEDDSVCVRNENIECDYQILKHEKTFSEINKEDI